MLTRSGGWKNGLVWRTAGLALVLSVAPAALVTILTTSATLRAR
jgi:hypothetical protein